MLDSGRNQNDNLATKGKAFDRVYEEVLKVGMRDARQAKLSVARKAGGEVTWSWTFPKPKPHASLQFLPKGHNLKHAVLPSFCIIHIIFYCPALQLLVLPTHSLCLPTSVWFPKVHTLDESTTDCAA